VTKVSQTCDHGTEIGRNFAARSAKSPAAPQKTLISGDFAPQTILKPQQLEPGEQVAECTHAPRRNGKKEKRKNFWDRGELFAELRVSLI